jgi:hypothetical protein
VTTIVDIVEDLLDGKATHNTLSNFDLDVDMLASRAFARDGNNEPFTTSPNQTQTQNVIRPPRLIIDDYLEDVSLGTRTNSSRSRRSSLSSNSNSMKGTPKRGSSIDDHYELVVVPQLEIILDAIRAVQHEVHHLHNEFMDMKVCNRHALKKIWTYLNYSVDDAEEGY